MTVSSRKMKVLIVDDYKIMLRITRKLLNQIGFSDIDEASDGQTALTMMKHKRYDLIISDWNMTPMNGLDLLKSVRNAASDVPFIMATSESKAESIAAARKAGVNNYIIKPFNAATLKLKIGNVLSEIALPHTRACPFAPGNDI